MLDRHLLLITHRGSLRISERDEVERRRPPRPGAAGRRRLDEQARELAGPRSPASSGKVAACSGLTTPPHPAGRDDRHRANVIHGSVIFF